VNAKDKGVANVVVWLLRRAGDDVPVHPDFQETAKGEIEMANKACQFVPRIALVRTSQTLVQANADAFGHNMKIDPFNNAPSNVIIPAMGKSSRTFTVAESGPTKVECSIHPWMGGYLLIRDDPYAAVSDASGKLTIPKLPVGEWKFKVWHERGGYVKGATLAGKPVEWKLGQLEVTVKAGQIDLGEARLKPAVFAKK
jgi:hypothetical protein